eukprot:2041656-Rhodomonas_salina.2
MPLLDPTRSALNDARAVPTSVDLDTDVRRSANSEQVTKLIRSEFRIQVSGSVQDSGGGNLELVGNVFDWGALCGGL